MGRKKSNVSYLKSLMAEYDLTRPQVASAVCVYVGTVDRWLVPPNGASHRKMPDMARKLLEYMERAGDFDQENC